jgi:hypothetical protein
MSDSIAVLRVLSVLMGRQVPRHTVATDTW